MVKLAVSVLIAAALASVAVAQDFKNFEGVNARDVAPSAQQDLFGRAAAKVMSDLFSREELNEMFGREVDELSQRDIEELFQREVEVDEAIAIAAREAAENFEFEARQEDDLEESAAIEAPAQTESAPPKPKSGEEKPREAGGSLFSQAMGALGNIFRPAKKPEDTKKSVDGKQEPKNEEKPNAKQAPAETEEPEPAAEEAFDARYIDFLEEPVERSFGFATDELEERFFNDEEAALYEARELLDNYADLFEREFDESELFERDFEDSELLEREYHDDLYERELEDELMIREIIDELIEREFNGDLHERDFDEDVFQREFDEDVFERDFDEDVLERELEDDLMIREIIDELIEREFNGDLHERDFEEDVFEREFDEDVFERDFEEDVFERDFEDEVFERDIGEEWDEALLRRAFDIIEELEQLD